MGEDWWRHWPCFHKPSEQVARRASGEEFQRRRQVQARRDEIWELMGLQQRLWRCRLASLVGFRRRETQARKNRVKHNEYARKWHAARRKQIKETETAEERDARLKKQRENKAKSLRRIKERETAEEWEARREKRRKSQAARKKRQEGAEE